MLDCGSREGFNELSKITKDGLEAVDVMYSIMPLSREDAKKILSKYSNDEEQIKSILDKTHCNPPEDYFITSNDMVLKSGVWGHFGSWDFNKGLIYNTLKKKEYSDDMEKGIKFLQERFNYSRKNSEDLFYEVQSIKTSEQANNWIAPWPGYAGTAKCNNADNETVKCGISGIPLVFNLTSHEAYADSTKGRQHPKSVSFPKGNDTIIKEYNESVITLQNGRYLSIVLVKDSNNYNAIAMDSVLVSSMFTRLFYQDGVGLSYFKKFSDEKSFMGHRIIVWKIDWGLTGNKTKEVDKKL